VNGRSPLRGEIWFVKLYTDPPDKGKRPVIIVSPDSRNNNPRANTVLVIPMSTSAQRNTVPTHILLQPGETGLDEISVAKAEDITVVRKAALQEPRERLRNLPHTTICRLASMVKLAMYCTPTE
jgi:mRNA-degrading endonuclease toxin of MazEF toxin-antitoxin module